MGEAAVTPRAAPPLPQWKPSPTDAPDIQGLVVSGYSELKHAAIVPIAITPATGPAGAAPRNDWLLGIVRRVTDCTGPKPSTWTVGFSAGGLAALGLSAEALASFPDSFRTGMAARATRLGDVGGQAPAHWRWQDQAGHPPTDPEAAVPAAGMVVMICDVSPDGLDRQLAQLATIVAATPTLRYAVEPLRTAMLEVAATDPLTGAVTKTRREHFGFADGLSQPRLVAETDTAKLGLHDIPVGDVVLGHPDAYGPPPLGPVVRSQTDPDDLLPAAGAEGLSAFGLNGTFMVMRELDQDVAGFWQDADAAASRIAGPGGTAVDGAWVAERILGRTRAGDLLGPEPGALRPRVPGRAPGRAEPGNDADFLDDRDGLGCPLGAHVRRANPRTGLMRPDGDPATARIAANRHRMLRRGRPYGPPAPDDGRTADGVRRGLVFLALMADIERQFEFVQHTWMLSPVFADLNNDMDPLLGPPGPFTLQDRPVRQKMTFGQHVTMRGGGYFFLPSLRALRYLSGVT